MNVHLFTFTGPIGVGKTEACEYLRQRHGAQSLAFASPIKECARIIWGLSDEQLYGTQEQKEAVDPNWGCSPREMFQLLGTEFGRNLFPTISPQTGKNLWAKSLEVRVRKLMADHSPPPLLLVEDCRFPNEADTIRALGGRIIRITRPSNPHAPASAQVASHESENSFGDIKPDLTLVNDGTLAEFHKQLDDLIVSQSSPNKKQDA